MAILHAPHFPPTNGLERAKNDPEEFIYGGSIAINRILGMLRESAYSPNRPEWAVIFISLRTLVVSSYKKDKTFKQITEDVANDIGMLKTYITSYVSANPARPPALIAFYGSDYAPVPQRYRRDLSDDDIRQNEAYQSIVSSMFNIPHMLSDTTPHLESWWFPSGPDLPNRSMFRILMDYQLRQTQPIYKKGAPVAVLTHVPSDLYVHRLVSNVMLWERFTGRVKRSEEFGTKLHKDGNLPFYPSVHCVFGDSVLIKPMITGKPRTALLEKARERRWIQMSESTILSELSSETGMRAADLSAFKF